MTKSELIEAVANKLKLPKGKAELIVNCVFDSMESALKGGERIEIRGFGSFEIRHYKAYEGRNPRTGAKVDVKPKRLPFFKVGKELKERVNEGAGKEPGEYVATSAPTAATGLAPAPAGLSSAGLGSAVPSSVGEPERSEAPAPPDPPKTPTSYE